MAAAAAAGDALVRLAEIPGRGRALVASRPIRAGELILSDSPILLYPAAAGGCCCSHCFRSCAGAGAGAGGCGCGALFCSPGCLSSHSPWLCAALARLPSSARPEARFLLAAHSLPPSDFHRLLSLSDDYHTAVNDDHTALAALLSSLALPPSPSGFPLADPALTAALLARDARNAFALMEPFRDDEAGRRRVRAYGIYPNASLFNHDCLPNACRFDCPDLGPRMAVRALHDIPEGREVCLSYFPVNWSYRERQRRLKEDYGFDCRCDRCEVEKHWKDDDEDGEEERDDLGEEQDNMVEERYGLGQEEYNMVEEEEIEAEEEDGNAEGDFPHAYFFVRFLCDRDNCGGTLAPLPPSPQGTISDLMECNVCGRLRKEENAAGDCGATECAMLDE